MANKSFDDRYPAMFQPGGERIQGPREAPVAEPVPDLAPDGARPSVPHGQPRSWTGSLIPLEPEMPASGPGPEAGVRSPQRAWDPPPWSPRALVPGIAASLLCLSAGTFALTATAWIPSARLAEPEDHLGMTVLPWGWLVLNAAAPLFAAGLGMLAAGLFLASLKRPGWAKTLRRWVAVLGVAALLLALAGKFFDQLFPAQMQQVVDPGNPRWPVPWQYFLDQAGGSFAVLGLAVLAVLAVVRPASEGVGGVQPGGLPPGTRQSAKAAWITGLLFLAAAAFFLFAQLMFPLSMAIETLAQGDSFTQTIPWPQRILPLAAPLTLAGAGTLMWAVMIQAAPRQRPKASPAPPG